jgi:hypothetical protein
MYMVRHIKKLWHSFLKYPILTTLLFCGAAALVFAVIYALVCGSNDFDLVVLLCVSIVFLPFVLTAENILLLTNKKRLTYKSIFMSLWELLSIAAGVYYTVTLAPLKNILFKDWYVQLYNNQKHSPVSSEHTLTLAVLFAVAVIGHICLRFIPQNKRPPLFSALCISSIYIGCALCVLWCIQISGSSFFLFLFPINYIILSFRVIACEVLSADKTAEEQTKMPRISAFLHNKSSMPVLALLLLIPLLGIIAVILLLFGQEPDSAIKLWTETADWTISQKIAPENLPRDGHYLCTVAAEGHKKLVKPLRTGKRHGHEITVNRQLCIANAFEQLLSERAPHLHRAIRNFYDKTGYPIAKHIKTPLAADIVYIIMKPLEWLFLLVLYLFDTKPENRIATQYPHSAPPKI